LPTQSLEVWHDACKQDLLHTSFSIELLETCTFCLVVCVMFMFESQTNWIHTSFYLKLISSFHILLLIIVNTVV